jgi:hypothetical protein
MVTESDRSPVSSIAIECASLMLGDALFEAAPRRSDVKRAVAASQNVQIGAQRQCVLRDGRFAASSG